MPIMQVAIHELNNRFGPEAIGNQSVEDFADELSFRDVIEGRLGIGANYNGFGAFLDTAPDGLVKAFHATIRSAIQRKQPVTVAWKPGYEWEFSMTDVADAGTPGGVTILIRSRYPGDASAVDSSAAKNA